MLFSIFVKVSSQDLKGHLLERKISPLLSREGCKTSCVCKLSDMRESVKKLKLSHVPTCEVYGGPIRIPFHALLSIKQVVFIFLQTLKTLHCFVDLCCRFTKKKKKPEIVYKSRSVYRK